MPSLNELTFFILSEWDNLKVGVLLTYQLDQSSRIGSLPEVYSPSHRETTLAFFREAGKAMVSPPIIWHMLFFFISDFHHLIAGLASQATLDAQSS